MIINSLLDTDFYKYVMAQFVFHYKPEQKKIAEYSMKVRSGNDLIPIKDELEKELNHWLNLELTSFELEYIASIEINGEKVFKKDFLLFLKNLNLKDHIKYKVLIEDGHLNIRVYGEWVYSIFAEVPFLAIVQELYWKNKLDESDYVKAEKTFESNLIEKTNFLNKTNVRFSEFGTRRRFSLKLQRMATDYFKNNAANNLLGTSNMLIAKDLGLKPVGTVAHECYQAMGALASSFETSQRELLEAWLVEYPNMLKIALTDIWGTDMFLLDFSKELTEKYDGLRQDSGVPREVALKYKAHYDKYNINTKTKTVLFSDDLNFEKADLLEKEFGDVFNTVFGIGTFCSNDTGNKPVSVVMKMVRMNGIDVIKVSDSEGKIMCENPEVIERTKLFIKNRLNKGE